MSHRCLAAVFTVIAGVALVPMFAAAQSTNTSTPPRTPWGQPDLQGIWDFRTITPMERPEELGDKAFLTEEEAANLEQEAVDRDVRLLNREAQRTEAGASVDSGTDGAPGAYNNFWMDRGTRPIETRRTSLIVDPPNGRLPDLSPVGQRRTDARREYLDEHPADSYVDRNTSDRCIVGFNAAPPSRRSPTTRHAALSDPGTTSWCSPRWFTRLASCRSMAVLRSTTASVCGRATREATGRAIPWSSRPRTSATSGGGSPSAPCPPEWRRPRT